MIWLTIPLTNAIYNNGSLAVADDACKCWQSAMFTMSRTR
jgi:hypothetical protein